MRPGRVPINATVAYLESLQEEHYGSSTEDEFVSGLLADLRHYGDAHELDFAELDQRAYQHYCWERQAAMMEPPDTGWPRPGVPLSIPLRCWEDMSTVHDRSVIAAQLIINEVPHYLVAVLVEKVESVRRQLFEVLAARGQAVEAGGPFTSVRLFGQEYSLDLVVPNELKTVRG